MRFKKCANINILKVIARSLWCEPSNEVATVGLLICNPKWARKEDSKNGLSFALRCLEAEIIEFLCFGLYWVCYDSSIGFNSNTVGPDWQMLQLANLSIAKCSNRQKADLQKSDWHLLDYQICICNFKAVFLLNIQKQFKAVFLSNLLKQKAVSGRISAKVQPAFAWLPNLHKQNFKAVFRLNIQKQFKVVFLSNLQKQFKAVFLSNLQNQF